MVCLRKLPGCGPTKPGELAEDVRTGGRPNPEKCLLYLKF